MKFLRSLAPGLSQRGLDTLAGLHSGHVWQIEQGERENLERNTSVAIARVFGCSLDWLLNGHGPLPDPALTAENVQLARSKREAAA